MEIYLLLFCGVFLGSCHCLEAILSNSLSFSHTQKHTNTYLHSLLAIFIYSPFLEAFAALKIAEEKFLTVSKSRIMILKLQLIHERALHR